MVTILTGDCREVLKTLPDASRYSVASTGLLADESKGGDA
jgi:hypothetical protein